MAYYVRIHYGPYESFFTMAHKPQKLTGVRDRLRTLGYRVDLRPVQYYNYCVFEMMGHEVFRCNIQNLQFNTEANLDPVSLRAIDACLLASLKLERARNHFFFWSLLQDSVLRTEYAPKDHWHFEIKVKRDGNCLECVQCCGEDNMGAKAKIEERQRRDDDMVNLFNYNTTETEFLKVLASASVYSPQVVHSSKKASSASS